jgi:hypothetical protein
MTKDEEKELRDRIAELEAERKTGGPLLERLVAGQEQLTAAMSALAQQGEAGLPPETLQRLQARERQLKAEGEQRLRERVFKSVRVAVPIDDDEWPNIVYVTIEGWTDTSLDPRPGELRVTNFKDVDLSDITAKATATRMEQCKADLDTAERAGDKNAYNELVAKIHAPNGIGPGLPGVKHVAWAHGLQKAMRKCVGGKPPKYLEDLIRDGVVRVITPAAVPAAAE